MPLEGNQNKKKCLVSNFYSKLKNFSVLCAYSFWKVCCLARLLKTVRLLETLEYSIQSFQVHLVIDGTSSRSLLDREIGIEKLKNIGAIVTTTEGVILNLLTGKDDGCFKEAQKLIKDINPLNKELSKL